MEPATFWVPYFHHHMVVVGHHRIGTQVNSKDVHQGSQPVNHPLAAVFVVLVGILAPGKSGFRLSSLTTSFSRHQQRCYSYPAETLAALSAPRYTA